MPTWDKTVHENLVLNRPQKQKKLKIKHFINEQEQKKQSFKKRQPLFKNKGNQKTSVPRDVS